MSHDLKSLIIMIYILYYLLSVFNVFPRQYINYSVYPYYNIITVWVVKYVMFHNHKLLNCF